MKWQYRTILFEFQKDGLLGDSYIDDDEMESVFNEQGQKGWELVNVTPVQEGLLSFFKRSLPEKTGNAAVKVDSSADLGAGTVRQAKRPVPQKLPAGNTATQPPQHKPGKPERKSDVIGDIKIS